MKTVLNRLLLLSSLFYSVHSFGLDYSNLSAYEIEVIIFKFTDNRSAGSEIWPDLVKTQSVENRIELHNNFSTTLEPGPDEKGYYYAKLPADKLRLSAEAEKLNNSKEYEILYHSGWIQPGLNKEEAEFIHIQKNKNESQLSVLNTLPLGIQNSQPDTENNQSIYNKEDEDNILLDGVVKVELGRYLHIHFDLKYQRNIAPIQGVMNTQTLKSYKEMKYYPIQTHRRMRSKEVHYIDHPLIGILVLATPYEIEKPEETNTQESQPLMKLKDTPVSN